MLNEALEKKKQFLKDVQSEQDSRNIPLKHVGISDLRWPLVLRDRQKGEQHTVATVSVAVDLPKDLRGTHMSRFVQCLQKLDIVNLSALEEVLEFPYFIQKKAPVSGLSSVMDLNCVYTMEKGTRFTQKVEVQVPIQTLCPCSREISAYGAHNQRAVASLEIEASEFVWIEELAEMADAGASAPVYGLLKRPDEKFVTEEAYDNPRFVEDAVREIALRLEADPRISWYRATVKSFESIHNHNAFACVEKGWK